MRCKGIKKEHEGKYIRLEEVVSSEEQTSIHKQLGRDGQLEDKERNNYLGKEHQFDNFNILVGWFRHKEDPCLGDTIMWEAKVRGFKLEMAYDDKEFITKLNRFDIVWIVDSPEFCEKL